MSKSNPLDVLYTIQMQNPSLRFGQIIGNVVNDDVHLYYMTDEELVSRLKLLYFREDEG